MENNMNYPYISFVGTANNEKTLILKFPTKREAYDWYEQLDRHNFCWYRNNKQEIIISLKVSNGSILSIRLLKSIESYINYSWLLNHELDHITTDFEGSGVEDKILPTPLNQQIPCP